MSLKLKKDAPMRARAVECLRAQGKAKLADSLAKAKDIREALKAMNEANRTMRI